MDDRDFFDVMYQGWSKTSGGETSFWMPEEDTAYYSGGPGTWNIWAVDQKTQERKHIASHLTNEDAAFITAVHGCYGDLTRRLHSALDEADSADLKKDERECRIAELELENDELREYKAMYEGLCK